MVTNPAKARGSQWERDVVKFLNDNGFPLVERRYGAGNTLDKGDINGLAMVLECKNLKSITLSSIMDELEVEVANSHFDIGFAPIKRRGKGASEGYAVLPLKYMVRLLKQAGY
jgi:hypothetical protein